MSHFILNPIAWDNLMTTMKLSPTDLARRLDMSPSTVSRVLRGERNPGGRFIAATRLAFPDYTLEGLFQLVNDMIAGGDCDDG